MWIQTVSIASLIYLGKTHGCFIDFWLFTAHLRSMVMLAYMLFLPLCQILYALSPWANTEEESGKESLPYHSVELEIESFFLDPRFGGLASILGCHFYPSYPTQDLGAQAARESYLSSCIATLPRSSALF
jgi:hypothetical protein